MISHSGQSYLGYKYSGGSHASQNSPLVHFGLGSASVVDSVKITWTNGAEQTYYDLPINQTVRLTQGQSDASIIGCTDAENDLYI